MRITMRARKWQRGCSSSIGLVVLLFAPSVRADDGVSLPEAFREIRETHWAYRPVERPDLPAVSRPGWCRNEIDRFVLAQLEAEGLDPAPQAPPRVLARRLKFDLLGLPPTPAELAAVEAAVGDTAAGADRVVDRVVDRLVDRYLASPRHGERWGRHWLDVARYADTRGYVFTQERRFAYSYTYRDYVIRAFNEDLPYDRFIVEQIAADQLDLGDDNRALAAMGFLTLGRRFLNNVHDIIDDRIDVVSRGLMGLTVSCARCHDHKYDPVPTEDYYSLYGVFASAREPQDPPLIGNPEDHPSYPQYVQERRTIEQEIEKFLDERAVAIRRHLSEFAADYLLAAAREGEAEKPEFFVKLPQKDFRKTGLERFKRYVTSLESAHDPVLAAWLRFASLSDAEIASRGAGIAAEVASGEVGGGPVAPRVAAAFRDAKPTALKDVARIFDGVFREALARQSADMTAEVGDAGVIAFLTRDGAPASFDREDVRSVFNRADRSRHREFERKLDALAASHPGAPPRAMSLSEADSPFEPYVFQRGQPRDRGPSVPRQFLAVLSQGERQPFEKGSGRLELARRIASESNPLTARVLVNRVWQHHFGKALVRTPGDFGVRGDPPTHPELLDYLAWRFVEDGWSVKRLHRLILQSRAYRQSSVSTERALQADPENLLVSRQERQRLEFEPLRDAMLAASGELDLEMGGRSVDILSAPFSRRRTVYAFIDRQNLPGLLRTFDFASPDTTTARRHETTVPQQALFLMNGPFVVERARALAREVEGDAATTDRERIERLYRRTLGRDPATDEIQLALEFLSQPAPLQLTQLQRLAQTLLMSNEFAFVD